jgi:hypothetical protein
MVLMAIMQNLLNSRSVHHGDNTPFEPRPAMAANINSGKLSH